uniref:U-box domain-containing protein 34-like n=1 Tax=Rhizophora mucronata TaxID=61149 RepID=A0A2P2LW73_RHIMU
MHKNADQFFSFIHRKLKADDVPSSVLKGAPEFCTVYVINKGKVSSVRSATGQAPAKCSLQSQLMNTGSHVSDVCVSPVKFSPPFGGLLLSCN